MKRILRLFGFGGNENNGDGDSPSPAKGEADAGLFSADPVAFVKYVTEELVNEPGDIKVSKDDTTDGLCIRIHCDKSDIGRVIGKRGRTIAAIRTLTSGIAYRLNKKVSVEVVEP